jgi:secondary thiamine-phosphate synthase enzyme
MQREITIRTRSRQHLIDITDAVQETVTASGIDDGVCRLFVPHTTAAVTINEKADPNVAADIESTLEKIVPAGWGYRHSEGNSDAHVKSSLIGVSEFIIVRGGRLVLGTWQAIFFCEFDGPRTRRYIVHLTKNAA